MKSQENNTIDRHVTNHDDKIVSHAQFKCRTVPGVSIGPKMLDIANEHMLGNYLLICLENKMLEER